MKLIVAILFACVLASPFPSCAASANNEFTVFDTEAFVLTLPAYMKHLKCEDE